jgi:phospho-N-acetylmuramoyl-pentapeptide-transferase
MQRAAPDHYGLPSRDGPGGVAVLYHFLQYLFESKHYGYENPLFRGTCAALLCFVLALAFLPRVIRQLVHWKVGDRPEFDHASLNELMRDKNNVPTMGGVMILGGIGLAVLLLSDLTNFYVKMGLVCLVWLGALGAVDDWLKLTSKRRGGSRDGLRMYEKLVFEVGLGVVLG